MHKKVGGGVSGPVGDGGVEGLGLFEGGGWLVGSNAGGRG